MKKVVKKEKEIPRINRAFAALVDSNGTQTEAAELLGFRSQDIGYYMKGRKIPSELIAACRKAYGYDLIDLEQMEFETMVLKKKENPETIVSRETKVSNQDSARDIDTNANEDWYKKTIDTLIHQNGETIGEFKKRDEKEILWLREMLASQIKPPNNIQ